MKKKAYITPVLMFEDMDSETLLANSVSVDGSTVTIDPVNMTEGDGGDASKQRGDDFGDLW